MGTWKKLEDAEGKSGVRYREHPTRKHGIMPDRYYTLAYWWKGRTVSEAIGWASENWTPTKCFNLLAQLRHNQKIGQGPCTLAEMRELAESEKKAKRKEQAAEDRLNVPFKTFFDDIFLPEAKTRLKPETTRKMEEHVRNWIDPVTGKTPMREIELIHINRIKGNLAGKSARTQQYIFRTLSTIWNAAADHDLVSGPCPTKSASFRLPKVDNERQRYLTIAEEKTLLKEVKAKSPQAHDMAVVALDAGLRFKEIATLSWGCVDLENGVLRVLDSKGRDRLVPVTNRLKELFESMDPGERSALVFPSRSGKVQTQVSSSFKRGLDEAKLNKGVTNKKLRASFHTLRHTFASRLVQAGIDIYRVQRLLGHSTPVMTARYSKLTNDDLRQAVKAMERAGKVRQSKGKVIRLRSKARAGK